MSELHEEHGPDCTCGCHDHEHHEHHEHHNHDHHGHDHEHDHTHHHHRHDHGDARERTVELAWGEAALESHTHEQASTVSATIHAQASAGKTFETLVDALQAIAQQVEAAGGIVGHIKAYARAGESFVHASSTDAQHEPACEGDACTALTPDVQCQLVAIALLIDLDQLEEIVVAALD